ncbi:MAG: DNA polymerase III subunit delta [Shimia sp.]
MKLSARDAAAYFARPDPDAAGALIYGQDAMRVAMKRKALLEALLGDGAEEEMRLTRLQAADLRRDPAALSDATRAQGFFPGARAVLVEGATDQHAKAVEGALVDWRPGDAQIVVVGGALQARSKLRKLFEGAPRAMAIAVYDDPPSRGEIEAALAKAGVGAVSREAGQALEALARGLGPGDFAQTVEKVALYALSSDAPLSADDVAACAPLSVEAELDDILGVVAGGEADRIGPILRRLAAQGVGPVTLSIGALRHFRVLHVVASDPGGPGAGIGKLRPPVFGPRRERVLRQAQGWGTARLEAALALLLDTDLQLRGAAQTAPQMATMERALIRLAMMGRPR